MAQRILNNGETNGVIRKKINDNFTELYKTAKSPYDIWLEQGNEGTEQDFLDSLVGEDGKKGDRGDSGVTVPTAGFFTVYVDENSDLYAIAPVGGTVPLEYDPDTGDLYYLAWRGDTDGNNS